MHAGDGQREAPAAAVCRLLVLLLAELLLLLLLEALTALAYTG
jgi:hypothetical protein